MIFEGSVIESIGTLATNTGEELPRLLYFSDVPVEASYHGSALLYRLLHDYPRERLAIVETGRSASRPERRLGGVAYQAALWSFERLSRTRLHNIHQAASLRLAAVRATYWSSFVRRSGVEAILAVSHGSGWITGATLADKLGLPLHLICHDEWARAGILQGWKDRVMGRYYRAAASRFCVSPFMAEEYERRYGVAGEVLYPSRAADAPRHDAPPARLLQRAGRLTVVFAGTINSKGMVDALRKLSASLSAHGGRLVLYGPLSPDQARADGLDADNVENRGLVPSQVLMERMRAEADVLYVPMSFADIDRNNMSINFPSKLADYTAVGVPLLIHGPEYSSAVRWARTNAGVAEVIVDADRGLDMAIARLATDPAHRMALGAAALKVGATFFGVDVACDKLFSGLRRERAPLVATRATLPLTVKNG